MMSLLSPQNILAWTAQVFLLISMGAILPAVFRIRHPRCRLIYWYALLCACLVLPAVQPWQSPMVSVAAQQSPEAAASGSNSPAPGDAVQWARMFLWILFAGIVARLCRLVVGLWRIRRYKISARAVECLPEPMRRARKLAARSAVICVADEDIGPATFGFFNPVIILPRSFVGLQEDAQCAIVCHELLHVRRKDWFVTVLEELIGACLWFHPAVWWLLAQTKLAREQVVDAEVIQLTAAPDSYIDALLVMSNAHPGRALSPAALFLYRRHLVQRLRSLVLECPTSTVRLVASSASMAAILTACGCQLFLWFPLMGQPVRSPQPVPQSRSPEPATANSAAAVTGKPALPDHRVYRAGGAVTRPTLISRVDPEYPDSAREARIQGTVIVQGIVLTDGTIAVTRVLRSLDATLDRNALEAMKQWRFDPGRLRGTPVRVEIAAEVDFALKL
jgi:TonB family protein